MSADTRTPMPPTPEETSALEVAAQLIKVGVPIFAAEPCPEGCTIINPRTKERHRGGPGQYHLPPKWDKTVPTPVWLERWRPGWALAAVGGHVVDFLDVDPRNGGDESLTQLRDLGQMPRVFAEARTPSGGIHYTISATGERKYTGFMPGLDLQSGNAEGLGRGFVWIAPTVRASKANHDVGALHAYRWEIPPNLEAIAEYAGTHDPTVEPIVARIVAKRSTPAMREPFRTDPEDPFLTASTAHGVDRSFSMREAMDWCGPHLLRLREAPIGQIEETANVTAAVLSHFVPNFWSVDQCMALLTDALTHTAYDPNGPSTWTVEKFRPVLDGTRPVQDPWVAQRKPEPAAPPTQAMESVPGEESLSTLEKLRRRLVSAEDLMLQPPPKPLVWGLLDLDTEAWMIGEPGSLKSFVALDLAGAVGAGREWQGHRVRQANVLVVAAEGGGGMVLRTRAYVKVHGGMPGVTFLPYPVQVSSNDGQWDALVQLATELDPGLIIIDTQARVSVGLEENSAKDMGIVIDAVGKLKRATGACVLVIHHIGRNGRDARGSSALDGAQDSELKVIRDEPRSALACHLVQDKQKDMSEDGGREGLPLRFRVIDLGADPETGRELSSLVLMDQDVYRDAEGVTEVQDPRQPWLPAFNEKGKWGRRYLDTLYTFAPIGQGLTKADLDRVMGNQWADWPKDGGRSAGPKSAWRGLLEALDPHGEHVVDKVGGERYGVTSLVVREALAAELGRPEPLSLPGLPTSD